MIGKLRILPVLIVAATALSGVKLGDLWRGIGEAAAAAERQPQSAAETQAVLAAATDGTAGEAASPEAPRAPEIDFSHSEVEVLQSLAKRREQLDTRAKEQKVRENVLKATEKRIDSKIEQLKQLEARIESLIKKRDAAGEKQLQSLVKVYENMKPKDAARIFEKLEMDILLDVAARMREQKIAPILADMDPTKARQLTVELATRKSLPATGG